MGSPRARARGRGRARGVRKRRHRASTLSPQATPPGGPVQTVSDRRRRPTTASSPRVRTFPLPKTPHAVRLDELAVGAHDPGSAEAPMRSRAAPSTSRPIRLPSADRFGEEAGDLIVTTQHWAAYQKAAEALAALVADDAAALDKLLPAAAKSGDTAARVAAFVVGLPAARLPASPSRRRRSPTSIAAGEARRCERERRRPVRRAREVDPHGDPPVAEASLSHQPRRGRSRRTDARA